ncbi:hypothetical protein U1Q18_012042, partial [Sarracenia purpurea var. burkii]
VDDLEPNDVFQQEEITEIVPIVVEDSMTIPLRRNDMEPEIIRQELVEGLNDDAFICDNEDELMGELGSDKEEIP